MILGCKLPLTDLELIVWPSLPYLTSYMNDSDSTATAEERSRRHFPSVKKSSPFLSYFGYSRCTGGTGCWQNKNSLRKKFGKPQRVNAAPHGGSKWLKRAKNKFT